jgi:hypothetical protein
MKPIEQKLRHASQLEQRAETSDLGSAIQPPDGEGKGRAQLSVRSVRYVAGVLNVALNKAFKLELIAENPMLRVELRQAEVKDPFQSYAGSDSGVTYGLPW